jgi:hypothetical protein
MIVAWTGHRPDLFLDPHAARAAVESAARDVVEQGADRFLVGGQRGVDTWAALMAIALAVPFVLILPLTLDEFACDWLPTDRAVLEHTATHASEVRIAGGYTRRNAALASGADLLVAVWTHTLGGGTAETIELARRNGTPLREIVLAPSSAATAARGRGV